MKKAEEYLKEVNSFTTRKRLYEIGKQMQIDAIYTAVKRCAESANIEYAKTSEGPYVFVNEQSILQVAEELKKELE